MSNKHHDTSGRFTSSTKIETPSVPLVPELEKPLVQVSITNPLRKIMYWLDQIRRHQTTTFAIKLSIPLIALPVIAVVFFQLGRNYAFPFPLTTFTSTPSPAPIPILKISKTGTFYIAKGKQTSYLLSLKDGGAVILEIPSAINVSKYLNKQILVTGIYNSSTNVLKVEDIAEIELFNSLSIPSESIPQVPKAATPSATSSQ